MSTLAMPGGSFSYGYDGRGLPSSVSNPYSETFAWTYLDNGWLWTQQAGNAAKAIYTYNALGQVTDLQHRKVSNNALLADFSSLSHDAVGNRVSLSASLPLSPSSYSGSTSYSYDSKEQLTQESSTRAGSYTNTFGYDLVGNPTTWKGSSQTFNSVNQNTLGGTITFDNNGNPQSWSGNALTYDANNKLVSIGTALTAGYGSDGLRAWKQSSAGRTYFLYDGLVPVCETDGSGSVTAVNTTGATGVLARHTTGTGGSSTFYAFDPQGSVALRLDTSGSVLSSHVNEAWGTQVSSGSGYSTDPYAGYGGQWGYYRDVETGLHLLGHRYYDASTGRFLNRDPIGYAGGINLYAYCENNPVNGADATGFFVSSTPLLCRTVVGVVTKGGQVAIGGVGGSVVGAAAIGYTIGTPIGNYLANRWFGPEVPTPESEEADQPYYPLFPINGRRHKHNPHQPQLPGLDPNCPPDPEPEPEKTQDPRDDDNDCFREVLEKHPVIRSDTELFRLMRACMEGKGYSYKNGRWVK